MQSPFQSVSEGVCFHHCGVYVQAPATRTRLHLAQPKPARHELFGRVAINHNRQYNERYYQYKVPFREAETCLKHPHFWVQPLQLSKFNFGDQITLLITLGDAVEFYSFTAFNELQVKVHLWTCINCVSLAVWGQWKQAFSSVLVSTTFAMFTS